MAAKGPARASLRYAKAPLSPRYQWELHQLLGHCSRLSGEVDSKQAKRHAEDCADGCSGVEHVQNNLRVRKSQSNAATEDATTASEV